MVFNTALCFLLTGIALTLPELTGKPMPKLQTFIGSFIFSLCLLILREHILDINSGIDWAFLHTWLRDGNTRPGRLAPNTAIGFMLIGTILILMNRVSNKWLALAIQLLTVVLLAIGLTGLVGYTLAPDLLFGWARSARMAIPTALGMIITAITLWLSWHRASWYQSRMYFQEDEKIAFIGAAILVVVTMTAGMTGFVFQHKILEETLKGSLSATLKSRVVLFNTVIKQSEINTLNASKAFFLQNPASVTAIRSQYAQIANHLLGTGFQAIAVYDLNDKLIVSSGTFIRTAGIINNLNNSLTMQLLWDKGLYLQSEVPIIDNGLAVAKLKTLQALPSLDQQLFETHTLANTLEIVACILFRGELLCFPEGVHPAPFKVKRLSVLGQPLPMSYAVDGKSGIITGVDYRGQNVVAAYASLSPGMGIVVKEDAAELYRIVLVQLKAMLPLLLLLVTAGGIFLRLQLRPIAAKLMISESKAQEKELEIKAVVGSVGEGILTIDEQGVIESFNTAASEIFGYSAQDIIGKNITTLMPPSMQTLHTEGMRRYLQGGEPRVIGRQGIELPGLRKDGVTFALALTVNEIRLKHHRLFVGIVRDITERKQMEEKLVFLAQNDALTGLPNRLLFMDRLSNALLRANRNHTAVGVMFLDLDGFKQVNDTLGHTSGDDLLKQLAIRLKATVRKADTVARLGGDEFTILVEGLTIPELAIESIADKIITAIQPPFLLGDKIAIVTTSIGLAIHITGEFNAEELLQRADYAMYRAKNSGKNRWCMDTKKNKY